MSSTLAGDKDPNGTVFDRMNGAIENSEENVEVFCKHFAQHGSKKQPIIAISRYKNNKNNNKNNTNNNNNKSKSYVYTNNNKKRNYV